MDRSPFSAYDLFGYLASGFLVILAVDFVARAGWLVSSPSPSVVAMAFWTGVAYVVGQILATPSAWLLESVFVGRVLGKPESTLIGARRARAALLFPGYAKPLPAALRRRITERAADLAQDPEALFLHAAARARSDPSAASRLGTFLNLYGFCRNVTFALLVCAGLLLGARFVVPQPPTRWLALAALVAAVGMLYRYLKFLRLHGVEVLVAFEAAPPSPTPAPPDQQRATP